MLAKLLVDKFYVKKQNPLYKELFYLASIASSSKNTKGVSKVLNYVANELKILGLDINWILNDKSYYPSLIAQTNPSLKHSICLLSHADTVVEPKSFKSIRFEGEYIIGPGVADNKAGILVALESLRKLNCDLTKLPFNIIFLVSSNEELGSPGFHYAFDNLKSNLNEVYGFEPSLPDGSLIVKRNGNYWLEVQIKGIEAHSGRAKGEEINAAHEFVIKYNQVFEEKKKYPSIRMNIGSMKTSKDVFNIVCGDISVKIDFRYEDKEEFKEFIEKVYIIFASNVSTNNKNKKAFYSFDLKDHCPPLEKARDYEEKLMPYILSVQNQENRRLNFNESGGAADINYLAHKDIFSVDGFGPVGGKLHCMDEYVWLPSLETRSNAFCNYLKYKARHETTIENRRGYGSPFSELRR